MLLLYMVIGAVALSAIFYTYGRILDSTSVEGRGPHPSYRGRDMWVASLLDCEYEPAKVRFGPAKIIPAKSGIRRSTNDKTFSLYMSDK